MTCHIDWKCTINSQALSWLLMLFKPNLYFWVLSSPRLGWDCEDALLKLERDIWLLKDCFLLLLFYGLIIFSVVLDIINLKAFNVCKYLISLHCVNISKPPLSTQSSKFLPCYILWTKCNAPNWAEESPKHCSKYNSSHFANEKTTTPLNSAVV